MVKAGANTYKSQRTNRGDDTQATRPGVQLPDVPVPGFPLLNSTAHAEYRFGDRIALRRARSFAQNDLMTVNTAIRESR